ncbi:MAG: hypothetical protein ACK5LS_13660 [Propioniciclava sp.]
MTVDATLTALDAGAPELLGMIGVLEGNLAQLAAWAPQLQEAYDVLAAELPPGETPATKAEALLSQLIAGGQQLTAGGQELAAGADQLARAVTLGASPTIAILTLVGWSLVAFVGSLVAVHRARTVRADALVAAR